jgi:probable rRNA maturation factor
VISVEVEDERWRAALPEVDAMAARAAEAALAAHAEAKGRDVAILLADDEVIRELNARFRCKDVATNVLSFPAAATARPQLGDVALAYGVCAREADAQGKGLADHMCHLVVHGVLHLLGYDHHDDGDAEAMEARERDTLAGLGVADPYRLDSEPDAGR